MLEKYLKKGIDYKRTMDTLDIGIQLTKEKKEEKNDSRYIIQQTKEKVSLLIPEYSSYYEGSLIWANNQKKLIQELNSRRAQVELNHQEPEPFKGSQRPS
ncbi:Uncharacterised protein [Legionella wadsworthii]|uniref:Uncharacterized protein n=1 Tax=Legionella wadsworthii TaxID=28088 RepID=A0A378LNX9_9GAMM|nr:hypothetical protein [Legionella wadsworthii]STY28636.1 Uncharacterised protein [Legionella wadsworthii]